jgi:hypothetical protein
VCFIGFYYDLLIVIKDIIIIIIIIMWVWFMVNNLLEHYGVDDLIEVHGSAGHGV